MVSSYTQCHWTGRNNVGLHAPDVCGCVGVISTTLNSCQNLVYAEGIFYVESVMWKILIQSDNIIIYIYIYCRHGLWTLCTDQDHTWGRREITMFLVCNLWRVYDKHWSNFRACLRKLYVWWGQLKDCYRHDSPPADTWLLALSFVDGIARL